MLSVGQITQLALAADNTQYCFIQGLVDCTLNRNLIEISSICHIQEDDGNVMLVLAVNIRPLDHLLH